MTKGAAVIISEEPISMSAALSRVPIAFSVESVYDIAGNDETGQFTFTERRITSPYLKNYDDGVTGERPDLLPTYFDVTKWGLLLARLHGALIGGALIALGTPEIAILSGHKDVAALLDLRVSPEHRRQGVGTALFHLAENWSSARGCRAMKIETQNINVPACKFYLRRACTLEAVRHGAYPQLPHELQLIWSKQLAPATAAA